MRGEIAPSLVKCGVLFEEDGAEEIVGAGINGELAELVLRCNGIGRAAELLAETDFDLVKESLFGRRERSVIFPSVDELLRKMRVLAKSLLVSQFGSNNGAGCVVTFVRSIAFLLANFSDITVVVAEMLLALNNPGVSTDDLLKLWIVKYFCHVLYY